MSLFRTILPPSSYGFSIHHKDYILSLGSCFAENIIARLVRNKFNSHLNPFGILYNPASIADCLDFLLTTNHFKASDLHFNQGLWHSFSHHGAFSHPDQSVMLARLNEQLEAARTFLEKTTCLILTLGTANTFVLKESGAIVANCHKFPASHFSRKMLEPADISELLSKVLTRLKTRIPQLNIILSVSPVRHIRDGFLENSRSKARLVLAAEHLSKEIPEVHYFPAYELILDDLRDYRFYKEDLVHPTDMAIDYVWQYFKNAFFSEDTEQLMQQIEKVVRASEHRPFHAESEKHQAFLKKQLEGIKILNQEHPYLNFEKEYRLFEGQMRK